MTSASGRQPDDVLKTMMADQNMEAKLKNLLKQEKVQLWKPPYTDDGEQPGQQRLQELAEQYAPLLGLPVSEVGGALESIRLQAVKRGKRNQTFRETNVATLELLLPRDCKKAGTTGKSKTFMETKLDVLVQVLMDRITEEFGLKSFKLILNGKTLNAAQRLDQQGVQNHSKMMVLKVSDAECAQQACEEADKARNQNESVQRTQRGFQILSERDGTDDPHTTPFLEVADQKGNPLKIPHKEKKALILAMGFHEKGRALMKRKRHDDALCHLLQADHHFSECGSALLGSVDNYGVLQLDIVWCYQALEALSCLDDGRGRLLRAEDCFLRCYGERQQRLLMIKGNTGREEALFLRLYLLQSLLAFIEGNDLQARQQLSKVESLYGRLCPDSDKMTELMLLGFSEREARLGLRACQGDVHEAAMLISNQRQEREELKQRERQKRKNMMANVSVLTEAGYSKKDAARALHQANGDVDKAFEILLDASQALQSNNNMDETASPEKLEQLLYLGFDRTASEAALALTGGDVQSATQLLLDNQGVVSATATPPSEEEPSTSSSSTDDSELVNEVLEDISRHEEDYLDLTLEEESQLIATIKTYLSRGSAHTV
uniref:NEDD8 ultimate buster 1-like isoform X1 n=2 Tax=Doryrhamphus excisus TaxID=161450 RepID=UPI0025AEABE6|nr:NEDD8 ultimate buster 1-like isoform X1 [Doryrhamphus excisus]XP_057916907.1 NEDD8 ultimate buster 1-like isoform X1 [Doryrhamphus excisus]XP_057916908.1 NEDD8 ultimate buster 1-like isoform X1 [Doryrhamphus excisus]XP_057916909.1 NEDD8 ultimate buster 1-like isoform X1 [Doryrhamphus excisus]XP_057916910.1 NEDD8 ultimate buster 1-like isoform X1 [Doryrhamphus excisus]XP_057916911.1 NEDD8 ultimate buster 1-like isoform X1 [Doryrhamphus excisus]